ncbi:MAG TPA: peptidylprolyl isomerase [Anaerolineae bacterium]
MAKKRRQQVSVKQRREAMRRRKQERQNLVIKIAAAVLALAVIALLAWQLWPEEPAPESSGAPLEGERPLSDLPPEERNDIYSAYPEMVIDTGMDYEAIIRTEKGDIHLELFDDEAPLTVNNFVFLATQGFYDNVTFHRVLPDFMAQGGDPTGTGSGGPGYQFEDETDNGLVFDRPGLLAMANAGPGTNGSQFFITYASTPHLNGAHTIFGELIEGEDVLRSLTPRDPQLAPAEPGDVIERIDIVESE